MTQSFSVTASCFVVVPVGFANFGLTRRHSHARRCEVNLFNGVISIFLCAYVCACNCHVFLFFFFFVFNLSLLNRFVASFDAFGGGAGL